MVCALALMSKTMNNLKPCPACGRKPEMRSQRIEFGNGKVVHTYFPICRACFITTKETYGSEEIACWEWNAIKRRGEP